MIKLMAFKSYNFEVPLKATFDVLQDMLFLIRLASINLGLDTHF